MNIKRYTNLLSWIIIESVCVVKEKKAWSQDKLLIGSCFVAWYSRFGGD